MTMRRMAIGLALGALVAMAITPLHATAPTGAIFTTNSTGTEVNQNLYPSKDAVYLDGGPGPGAPATAAGLDDGTYVFQVTDPSGKTLLSTDAAKCRQFTVAGGIITGVVNTGCQHATGTDADHNAVTVQLIPYLNTPNNGGVYKAWATKVGDYLAGCTELGVSNGLDVVDCGGPSGGNFHGFVASDSKTDNFKVKTGCNREIDTTFISNTTGAKLLGRDETWIDTLHVSNVKWSYESSLIPDLAHIEMVEDGAHHVVLENQIGCTITQIGINATGSPGNKNNVWYVGPQTLTIRIKPGFCGTIPVTVFCNP